MTTTGLKDNIHQAVDKINDPGFLKAVYTILAEKLTDYNYKLNPEQKQELDRRRAAHKKGDGKSYSWPEARKMIKPRLSK